MTLQEYEQKKFDIAEILRSALVALPADAYDWQQRLRDLFARLAEDRFNLVVVGRFNRGKTSLMNAIIGSDRLPVGIIPLTSVITSVSYGSAERVVLKFNNRILTQEVPIESIRQYVTQEGNPGNARDIKVAETQLRAQILRRGFYLVDTPGLGSPIIENTATTDSYLPEADAFVLVTSYENPISDEETRFLRNVASSSRRIFFVINKQDTISAHEREIIVSYVQKELKRIFGDSTPDVFSVSAAEGVEAKLCQDATRLTGSGIPVLEKALLDFLLAEKQGQFLLQMCGRVAELIDDLPRSPHSRDLSNAVTDLSERLRSHEAAIVVNHEAAASQATHLPTLRQLRTCEICEQANEALWQFAATYQYEISVNDDERQCFANNGGLCSFHTWQYHGIASSYGTCNAYPVLLDQLAAQLRNYNVASRQDTIDHSSLPISSTAAHCAFCAVRLSTETAAIADLCKQLSQNSTSTLDTLSAICIPHLVLLAKSLKDPKLMRQLFAHAATLLEHLSEDMKRFSLKRDSLTTRETKEELTAAERALRLVAGHPNVNVSGTYARVNSTTDRNG
jgi:tRNA U34 5-carboxymethylaminomethyl modifying GTPase MnmE/TrmE